MALVSRYRTPEQQQAPAHQYARCRSALIPAQRSWRLWPFRIWISRIPIVDMEARAYGRSVLKRGWSLRRSWRCGATGEVSAYSLRAAWRMRPRLKSLSSGEYERIFATCHLILAGVPWALVATAALLKGSVFWASVAPCVGALLFRFVCFSEGIQV